MTEPIPEDRLYTEVLVDGMSKKYNALRCLQEKMRRDEADGRFEGDRFLPWISDAHWFYLFAFVDLRVEEGLDELEHKHPYLQRRYKRSRRLKTFFQQILLEELYDARDVLEQLAVNVTELEPPNFVAVGSYETWLQFKQ